MKKTLAISILSLFVLLVGCADATDEKENQFILDYNQSLALSTYLASSVLAPEVERVTTSDVVSMNLQHVSADVTTWTLEDEEMITHYFKTLKVFLDEGVTSTLAVTETTSSREEYEHEIAYKINYITYTIFYSLIDDSDLEADDHEQVLKGILMIDNIEYQLTGSSEIEEDEMEISFETIDHRNTGNSVVVEIEMENGEQEFEMTSVIDGVTTESSFSFESEEEETEVEIEFERHGRAYSYEIKRELVEGVARYLLEYEADNQEIELIIKEIRDEEGNVTYDYIRIDDDADNAL